MGTNEEMAYVLEDAEVIASLVASVGFTSTYITDAKMGKLAYVLIQPHGGAVHFQTNGDDAATDEGIHLAQYSTVELWGYDAIKKFRCIDDGGTATLSCKYYGY